MEQKLFTHFIGTLLDSRNQAKVYHWQVLEEGSYAAHKALDEYQEAIEEVIDGLVESYQGRFGIVRGFKRPMSYREDNNPIPFFEALRKYVEINRYGFTQTSYVQNQVDEAVATIESLLYKLKNLQ
jgi:hypothetical protein